MIRLVAILAALVAAMIPLQGEDPSRMMLARDAAGEYILRFVDWDGLFLYQATPTDPQPSADYNILRHAGSMMALATYATDRPDRRRAATAALGAAWARMRDDCFGPAPGHPGAAMVWRGGNMPPDRRGPREAPLGANGLALVAGCWLRGLDADAVPMDDLRGLGNGILAFQAEDGSFRSRMFPDGSIDPSWGSLYYPGEAALGLALLERVDADGRGKWSLAGCRAMAALGRNLQGCPPPDHWALIAIGELLPQATAGDREAMLGYARQVAERMLATGVESRCNPEATRMEGLAAAHSYLPDLRREIELRMGEGADLLLRMQYQDGLLAGGFPDSERKPVVRIDNVQHALCALRGAMAVLGRNKPLDK
jgi:hypothetical protein